MMSPPVSRSPKNHVVKIAILGDGASGKTSLLRAKQGHCFDNESAITIGVDFQTIPFEFKKIEDREATFLAIDLGGQKRFHFIHDAYLKGTKMGVIMYDLTRYPTFLNIPRWYGLLMNESPTMPVLIVGSKKDLVPPPKEDFFLEEFRKTKPMLPHPENIRGHYLISSKSGDGIEELFLNCEVAIKELISA